MDRVAERSERYKQIALRLDPDYGEILGYIDIVKQFISDTGAVIYGGTAIDYALRLRGDSIYDDDALEVPDLDFYAKDSVGDSRRLADILYRAGAEEARSFVAMHVETMRVDCGRNHFIADISYMPMLDDIPTVIYSGMKCVHPDYQRGDLHSSLAFPFDNAPQEVIFARWKKDVCRLNKLDAAYPVSVTQSDSAITETHRYDGTKPLYGWAAFCALMRGRGSHIAATMRVNGSSIVFNTMNSLELVTDSAISGAKRYRPYANLVFERYVRDNVTYYSTEHRLIGVVDVKIQNRTLQCVCAQGILMYMLGMWFFTSQKIYLAAYCDLWELVKSNSVKAASDADKTLNLTLNTYGSSNMSHTQLMQINQVTGKGLTGKPTSHISARNTDVVDAAPFSYDAEFYQIDGREVIDSV